MKYSTAPRHYAAKRSNNRRSLFFNVNTVSNKNSPRSRYRGGFNAGFASAAQLRERAFTFMFGKNLRGMAVAQRMKTFKFTKRNALQAAMGILTALRLNRAKSK